MLKKGVTNGLVFCENYKSRFPVYWITAKELGPDTRSIVLFGNTFAVYCGASKNLLIASQGALVFGMVTSIAAKFMSFTLDKYRLTER